MNAVKVTAGATAFLVAATVALPKVAPVVLPAPYKDGCSGGMSFFYRKVLNKIPEWEACCDIHDKVYGPGGTSNQRAVADKALFSCVEKYNALTATIMYVAVRLGGTPFFPFGWRWGYEKDYGVSWWYERSGAE